MSFSVHSWVGLSARLPSCMPFHFCLDGRGSASLTVPLAPALYDNFVSIMFGYYRWPNLRRPSRTLHGAP
jgi:hypothetical protein